jgi:hypothetical protein
MILAFALIVGSVTLVILTRKNRRPLTDAMAGGYFLLGVGNGFHAWVKTEIPALAMYIAGSCVMLYGIYRHHKDQRELEAKAKTR